MCGLGLCRLQDWGRHKNIPQLSFIFLLWLVTIHLGFLTLLGFPCTVYMNNSPVAMPVSLCLSGGLWKGHEGAPAACLATVTQFMTVQVDSAACYPVVAKLWAGNNKCVCSHVVWDPCLVQQSSYELVWHPVIINTSVMFQFCQHISFSNLFISVSNAEKTISSYVTVNCNIINGWEIFFYISIDWDLSCTTLLRASIAPDTLL